MRDEIKESIRQYYEVYFEISAVYEKLAKMHGLTSASLFVLQEIYENQGQCTQRLICDRLLYPKQTVNTILDSFEKKGYILKQVADFDKRNKYIQLTESGIKYADSILADMLYLEEESFFNMEEEERNSMINGERAFLNQLTQIMHSLELMKSSGIQTSGILKGGQTNLTTTNPGTAGLRRNSE
ncbi:DNA-binding transcriptional regulator, MarR family [Anaerocolumna jejuensis DSM 15929]|uniref:DNA-binding transcriptional regulator, MarR family n=1 Tax=Anaerocolumna jejuensis DSM 15929 TaxID=1121322 RepID=A0A1M6VRX5_9FIRM|nr:MarR family transcriptional regulator [Anaerocolumna jejuensis]SHK83966.1 DNA-binding transcriptional regulator, MarR family [Anaerocolumna jejuensis DSM 15929]